MAPVSFPDHSVIVWKLYLDAYIGTHVDTEDLQSYSKLYDKFDVSRVSEEFLTRPDIIHEVNTAMFALENSLRTQCDDDLVYNNWCDIVRRQMYSELPYKSIKTGMKNKKRRVGKPWWKEELTELWNVVCDTERKWLKCTAKSDKAKFKSEYVTARKSFDREVPRSKRLYWFSFQRDLTNDCNFDNDSF